MVCVPLLFYVCISSLNDIEVIYFILSVHERVGFFRAPFCFLSFCLLLLCVSHALFHFFFRFYMHTSFCFLHPTYVCVFFTFDV